VRFESILLFSSREIARAKFFFVPQGLFDGNPRLALKQNTEIRKSAALADNVPFLIKIIALSRDSTHTAGIFRANSTNFLAFFAAFCLNSAIVAKKAAENY